MISAIDRREQLLSLLSAFDVAIASRDWQGARAKGREAATIALERDDVSVMGGLGANLERLEEYALAGQLLAKAARKHGTPVPEWNGEFVQGTLLIEQRIRDIGAPIRNGRHIPVAAKFADRCVVIINPRLEALFRRSFPAVEVHKTNSAHAHELRRTAQAVASFETLMQHLAPSAAALAANFSPFKADPATVADLRERYRRGGSGLAIGLAWASTNSAKDLPPLSFWAELIRTIPANFVSLQYGDIRDDIGRFREAGAQVIDDPTVNSLGDLDRFAAQISALDAVITISNTAAHMTGALAVPAVVLLDDKFHLIWPADKAHTPWYPNSFLIRREGRNWDDLIPAVRRLVLDMVKSSPSNDSKNSEPRTLISDEYRSLNSRLHETNDRYGNNGRRWARKIADIAASHRCTSILDYGCGKGSLAKELTDFSIVEYDPAIPGKAANPSACDLVVCTDVLEHIEPDCLSAVLAHISSLGRTRIFFAISTRPAVKFLEDGRNTHLIVQDERWWRTTLQQYWIIDEWICGKDEIVGLAAVKDQFRGDRPQPHT